MTKYICVFVYLLLQNRKFSVKCLDTKPTNISESFSKTENGQSSISSCTKNCGQSISNLPIKDRKGIELDISSKKETDEYKYKLSDYDIGIYSAESEYAFNLVKDGRSVIWKASDKTQYADYVDVCDIGIRGKEVRIFMLDRTVKIFKRCCPCSSWALQEESLEFDTFCQCFSWKCLFTFGLYNCMCKNKC